MVMSENMQKLSNLIWTNNRIGAFAHIKQNKITDGQKHKNNEQQQSTPIINHSPQ